VLGLYQVKDTLNLRFDIKKLGVSEFQIRGALSILPVVPTSVLN
jgi:hypothetical protein